MVEFALSDQNKNNKSIPPPDWSMECVVSIRSLWEISAMAGNVAPIIAVVTEKKSVPTLDEKIKQRNFTEEHSKSPIKVHVEIGGNHYLLSATDDMSEARIRKIASVANELLTSTLDNNPGLTNSKAAILALIDCCDQLLSEKEQCNNFRTDLMYYQQQYLLDKQNESKNPTPVELLVSSKGKDNKDE